MLNLCSGGESTKEGFLEFFQACRRHSLIWDYPKTGFLYVDLVVDPEAQHSRSLEDVIDPEEAHSQNTEEEGASEFSLKPRKKKK
jgi:hypothetical protein